MRIGIDIAPLRPPYTGVANYEIWLIEALLASGAVLDLRGFAYRRWRSVDRNFLAGCLARADKGPAPTTADPAHRDSLVSLASRVARTHPALHMAASAFRDRLFARSVRGEGIGLFHAFMYRAPSREVPVPVVPVVWDLSHVRHPETHPPARIRWMRRVEQACRDAPAIHTISDFTAREITEVFGIERSRIHVIPPAVGPILCEEGTGEIPARLDLLPREYALTVSTLEPRKNLRTLLAAFAGLSPVERARMPLVVVGAKGWGDLGLGGTIDRLLGEGSVRLAGYVTDAELAALYRGARVMLYPSLYEGFGMPVIEALAAGTPVVVSDAASLPEAAGGAGRLVPPLDLAAWTAELRRALGDEDAFSSEAVQGRRSHALSWTWADAAERTLGLYRTVLGRGGTN